MTGLVKMLRYLSVWLFLPGLALVTWGELTPHPPNVDSIFGWDKLEHFTAYFGLAAMITLLVGPRRRLLWAVLGIIAFSGLLEILQGYTGRDPEILDFVANSFGALCGSGVGLLFLLAGGGRPLVGAGPSE